MGKIFIINDTSITGGAASAHDLGTTTVTWRNAYLSGTITVGTASITGDVIVAGTASVAGSIIGSSSLTIGTGTIAAAKITATTGSFTALLTAGTASISGAIIGGTTITVGTVSATGQLISAHTAGVVGQLAALNYTFSTASALQVVSIATPFAGSIDNFYVTTGSVSAVVAQYTVRVGSAGSVAVATVANTTASQGVQESLTTSATTYALTNGLVVTRSAQGTAGDTSICIVVRKTA